MLDNGERQVAPELSGIRRDHVARYKFAAWQIGSGQIVFDFACGIGYGAKVLADAGNTVFAADRAIQAITYGRSHYDHKAVTYIRGDIAQAIDNIGPVNAAVCFETLEHLDDPFLALKLMARKAGTLIASVPNEERYPFRGQLFHKRHFTRKQFADMLAESGWCVTGWYGQADQFGDVEPGLNGRTTIVTAVRQDGTREPVPVPSSPAAPHHVSIVGLGPSMNDFVELTKRLGGRRAYCDEVWGINCVGDVLACDRVFHMDDVKVQEARAAARPGSNIDAMVKWLKTYRGIVYTSRVRDGYPCLVAFPLQDVLNGGYDSNGGAPYFNSTAAYAVAYAIHIGVRHISLWGVDYTLPNVHTAERGRACVEFWLGIAAARGVEISLPEHTTLLDACAPEAERLYGYDCVDVTFETQADGKVALTFADREAPTAAEIERRYDHSKHPNRLMTETT